MIPKITFLFGKERNAFLFTLHTHRIIMPTKPGKDLFRKNSKLLFLSFLKLARLDLIFDNIANQTAHTSTRQKRDENIVASGQFEE